MFYNALVLGKKGPLAKIWLAAHYRKKLRKQEILAVNICQAVDTLMEPRIRMSLRTMSHLLVGVTVIHNRQTYYLLDDLEQAKLRAGMKFAIVDAPEAKLKARPSHINLPDVDQMIDLEPIPTDTQKIIPQLVCPVVSVLHQRAPNLKTVWETFSEDFSEEFLMEGPSVVVSPGEILFEDSFVTGDGFGGQLDQNPDDIFGPSLALEKDDPNALQSLDSEPLVPQQQPAIEVFSPSTPLIQFSNEEMLPKNLDQSLASLVPHELDPGSLEESRPRGRSRSPSDVPNDFVLEPIAEVSQPRRKRRKVRHLIVDRQKSISKTEFNRRLQDVSDIITPRELLFISKYKAKLKIQGNVKYLLSNSSQPLISTSLKKLYQSRLVVGDILLEDNVEQEKVELSPHFAPQPSSMSILRARSHSRTRSRSRSRPRSANTSIQGIVENVEGTDRRKSRKKKLRPTTTDHEDEGYQKRAKVPSPSSETRRQTRGSESFRRGSDFYEINDPKDWSEIGPIPEDSFYSQVPPFSSQDKDLFLADLSARCEDVILFSSLMLGCRRQEVAAKFFQLLVLHKQGILKLIQSQNYGEIFIHK